ncbi:two-component regulator propeller domain-containing protein [Reichenbachiella agariperforans]|uniref:two-component regulator propeller domain-containing protein n=1 Tax=Reichenbachiella agariperforans TaxID=156994 RepID=UPI001C083398|nr:two-component regulator propeller domain-containing protein [Reichenbachiella agariperforans]MBU2912996.1 response regulator [Reichenbachiella agariperforans]
MVRRLLKSCYSLVVVLMGVVMAVHGAERLNQYVFTAIDEGMSKRAVTSFAQDKEGFIWISTFGGGLYRYDGLDYKQYNFDPNDSTSLNSNVVFGIYNDSQGVMWVITDNGVCRFNKDNDSFDRLKVIVNGVDVSDRSYLAMAEDDQSNLLFSAGGYGLLRYDRQTETTDQISVQRTSIGQLQIEQILTTTSGEVYLASSEGVMIFDSKNKQVKKATFDDASGGFELGGSIISLYESKNGDLWVGTQLEGVFRLSHRDDRGNGMWSKQNIPVSNKRILSMMEDKGGLMLVGTENDGLWLINEEGEVVDSYYYDKFAGDHIKANSIWSLYRDHNDRIWLGYYDKGVGLYDPNYDKFNHLISQANDLNSLHVGSVSGIVEDRQGKYWISMDGGGIDIYDPETGIFEHTLGHDPRIKGMKNKAVQALLMDQDFGLWAGSWEGGLFYLPEGSERFQHFNLVNDEGETESIRIISLAQGTSGILWLGTFGHGLLSFDPKTKQFTTYLGEDFLQNELVNVDVRTVLIDTKNDVWVGSTRGLYRLSHARGDITSWEEIKLPQGDAEHHASITHVVSLFEDSRHNMWIGTDGGGLCRYDPSTVRFEWYNSENGLLQETISGIIEDDQGKIWLSGQSGITSLDIDTGFTQQYSVHDGLLSNAYNFNATHKNNKGELFFGNYAGIDYFNPKDLITNRVKPKVYLTEFRLFNEPVLPSQNNAILQQVISETEAITLMHDQSVFTIQFVGLNYTRPEENEYAFYLEGLESDWNYVGNKRSATYTSLTSGEYVFRVKAANNDGVWGDEVRELTITVLPPWWKTKTAFMLYLSMFMFLLYLFFRVIKIRVHDKQAVLTAVENRKREEELNDKKIQFFTNISHEFRTPLTLIMNPLRDILHDPNVALPERMLDKLQVMYKNSDLLKRLIDELMDFRKLKFQKLRLKAELLDVENAVRAVCDYFQEEALFKEIDLDVIPNPTEQLLWMDRGMLEKIMFNLLSNAFKVTPQQGSIQVHTELASHTYSDQSTVDSLKIRIRDTGPGLDEDQLDKIFERFYQVDKKNKDYFGGTGIGLEVVKDFITLNKGDIIVESEVGVGTSFVLCFRLGDDHLEEGDKVDAILPDETLMTPNYSERLVASEETEVVPEQKRKTILVVEDNLELRKYLKNELSPVYKVLMAKDGQEGLEMAVKEIPDLILTDVVMPRMTGLELCAAVKGNLNTSHIPILMLTAKSSADEHLEGIDTGADAYITKPFDMRLVLSQLSQLVQSREVLFAKYFKGTATKEDVGSTTTLDKGFIQKLLDYVHANISKTDLRVESLADELNLSRSQLYRKVKAITGSSVNEFTRNVRLNRAHKLIEQGNTNISEVSYSVGFSSPSYFTKCFKEYFGYLPTDTPSVS